jgi:hypothetical protein
VGVMSDYQLRVVARGFSSGRGPLPDHLVSVVLSRDYQYFEWQVRACSQRHESDSCESSLHVLTRMGCCVLRMYSVRVGQYFGGAWD